MSKNGIRLRIYQSHNKSNGIGFIINPSTLLSGKYQPIKLWKPAEEAVGALLEKIDDELKTIGLNSVKAKDLSLSQMDVTKNMRPGEGYDVTSVLRCYHKCLIPQHFKVINANDKETKKHLFVMKNDTIAVKLYDKIYELKENHRCPESLKKEFILRFEVSLKREAFLKKLHLDREASLYKMLLAGYEQGKEIMDDYNAKMFPFLGNIVKYETAKKRIISSNIDDSLKKQMRDFGFVPSDL